MGARRRSPPVRKFEFGDQEQLQLLFARSIQIGTRSLACNRQFVSVTAFISRRFAHGRVPLSTSLHFTARRLRERGKRRGAGTFGIPRWNRRQRPRTMNGYSSLHFLGRQIEARSVRYEYPARVGIAAVRKTDLRTRERYHEVSRLIEIDSHEKFQKNFSWINNRPSCPTMRFRV